MIYVCIQVVDWSDKSYILIILGHIKSYKSHTFWKVELIINPAIIFQDLARLKFLRHSKKYEIFGNNCFSRHQIPAEKIHPIESEVTQNKEQHSISQND